MNKIAKIIITSYLLTSTTFAVDDFTSSEILPYMRVDSGLTQFHRVQGLSQKLQSKNTGVVGAGIGLGINFGDNIRSDINWSHHLHPQLYSEKNHTIVKRKPLINAYFLNLYYETNIRLSIFNPYLGVGIGLANIGDKISYCEMKHPVKSDFYHIKNKNNLAYKLIIGSAFELNERIKFDLSYNYHDYGKTKKLTTIENKQIGGTHYRAHIISAGLRLGV